MKYIKRMAAFMLCIVLTITLFPTNAVYAAEDSTKQIYASLPYPLYLTAGLPTYYYSDPQKTIATTAINPAERILATSYLSDYNVWTTMDGMYLDADCFVIENEKLMVYSYIAVNQPAHLSTRFQYTTIYDKFQNECTDEQKHTVNTDEGSDINVLYFFSNREYMIQYKDDFYYVDSVYFDEVPQEVTNFYRTNLILGANSALRNAGYNGITEDAVLNEIGDEALRMCVESDILYCNFDFEGVVDKLMKERGIPTNYYLVVSGAGGSPLSSSFQKPLIGYQKYANCYSKVGVGLDYEIFGQGAPTYLLIMVK